MANVPGAGAGRGMAQQPNARAALQAQMAAQEALRKQRKCVSCGNTAQAKCDFRACGTCCGKAKNPCHVHGARQAPMASPMVDPNTAVRPQQQYPWLNNLNMNMMYMRPSTPYAPSPYNVNPALGYRYPSYQPSKIQQPQSEASRAAQMEKNKKVYLAAQKDAQLANLLRVFKLREFADAETAFSDEAFDRYLRNSSWLAEAMNFQDEAGLEEVLGEESGFVETAARWRIDSKRKRARTDKLQRLITKGLQKLNGDGDMDTMLESRYDFNQGRRDTKRMRIQTADGKELLRKINALEDLFQGMDSLSSSGDIDLFMDNYRASLGYDLGHSLPKWMRKKAAEGKVRGLDDQGQGSKGQGSDDVKVDPDGSTSGEETLVAQVPIMSLDAEVMVGIQQGYFALEAL